MNKATLRKKYKELRSNLTYDQIDDYSIEIANQLLKLPIWDKTFYHIFLPIQKQYEVNTEFILNILQGKDKNVLLSKSDFENATMEHLLLTDTTKIEVNKWGIPEPIDGIPITEDKIEVVFVPLLAFDQNGNRVGYGKGFYDRFLSLCKPETLKIGVSFFEPEASDISDINDTDISLDYCVTRKNLYRYKK